MGEVSEVINAARTGGIEAVERRITLLLTAHEDVPVPEDDARARAVAAGIAHGLAMGILACRREGGEETEALPRDVIAEVRASRALGRAVGGH